MLHRIHYRPAQNISGITVGENDVLYLSDESGMEIEDASHEKAYEAAIPITMSAADMEHALKANIPRDIPARDREKFASLCHSVFSTLIEI